MKLERCALALLPRFTSSIFPICLITVHHNTFMYQLLLPHPHPLLSTSVQYHSWCSPGYSTSPPRPEKSSSSSCSVWTRRPPTDSRPARLKPRRTARTSAAGLGRSAAAAASPPRPRREPGGPPGRKRGRCGEGESGCR